MDTRQPPGYFEPIHQEFHANNPASCCLEHAAGFRATIAPSELTLSSMDSDIACLSSIMDNLNRVRLKKVLLRNQCLPVSSLPPEILQEIFIACLDTCAENTAAQRSKLPVPLRLAHVCSLWRTVALKLPILWSTVNYRVSHPRTSMDTSELIFHWISRSKGRPLTIRISFEDERLWTPPEAPIHIINTLVNFSESWKHVSLIIPDSWKGPLSYAQGRLDCLETLRIQPPASEIGYGRLDAFSIAPLLYSLSFERYYLQNLVFPWTNITKASIRQPSLDEVFEFMSWCPSLTECFIMNPTGNENLFPWPVAGFTHSGIKDLTIMLQQHFEEPEQAIVLGDILDQLITPSLERLTVLLKGYDNPLVNIALLIERSRCPLSLVEIFGPTIREGDMITFIRNIDSVSHITNNPRDAPTFDFTV